jgi:hypothetical protein
MSFKIHLERNADGLARVGAFAVREGSPLTLGRL